jgi:predicted nucleic acid-binding protein
MSADLCLVDSNVLVYALYADGPHHAPSKSLLEKAGNRAAGFCVTSQVLAEFFSIVTNLKRVTVAQSAENGGRIFDLQIAATMQANGVNCIYTFNSSDFQRFTHLNVLTP